MASIVALLALGATPAEADPNPIEDKYAGNDPSNPPWFESFVEYDNGGHAGTGECDIEEEPQGEFTYTYPGPPALGAFGEHQVVVWASGTAASVELFLFDDVLIEDPVCVYKDALKFLAAWGFVVVAPNDGTTGTGAEVQDAIDDVIARNNDPQDPFHNNLDLPDPSDPSDDSKITVIGHSQGAAGAINAAVADSRITSVLALAKADPAYCDPRWDESLQTLGQNWSYDCATVATTSQLDVPTFFVSGARDCIGQADTRFWFWTWLTFLADPPRLDLAAYVADEENTPCISTEASNKIFYDAIPGAAARAVVQPWGTDETQEQGAGHVDMGEAVGYAVAWAGWMSGNPGFADAADVFCGASPEISTNSGWTDWHAKNLPCP